MKEDYNIPITIGGTSKYTMNKKIYAYGLQQYPRIEQEE